MYAITFDLDTESLRDTYHNDSYKNAYAEIRGVLVDEYGFGWQQGSVYFGGEKVDAVTCVLAVQDLSTRFDWFSPSVKDIRMLRIEDNNDLMPAIKRAQKKSDGIELMTKQAINRAMAGAQSIA